MKKTAMMAIAALSLLAALPLGNEAQAHRGGVYFSTVYGAPAYYPYPPYYPPYPYYAYPAPGYAYAPPPVVYAPAYAPPPVVVAPAPVVGFGVRIR